MPSSDQVLSHLRDRYGIDATGATKVGQHNDHVFHVERSGGEPWIARVFPLARPVARVEGDAAILRFLERHDFPAERLAVDDAVSSLDGAPVLVTRFVDGAVLPDGPEKMAIMGDLLGRLHALPLDDSVDRPGGAAGDDPRREGRPSQDRDAGLALLDEIDSKVAAGSRDLLERLREQVQSADAGESLPEGLLHGNLLHNPNHALLTDGGPVAINWKSAGRGPRLADLAYLLWGAEWGDGDGVAAAMGAYRHHVELADPELDRLEPVMHLRPLYLACFDFRRAVINDEQPTGSEWWWGLIDPGHITTNANAAKAALGHH